MHICKVYGFVLQENSLKMHVALGNPDYCIWGGGGGSVAR